MSSRARKQKNHRILRSRRRGLAIEMLEDRRLLAVNQPPVNTVPGTQTTPEMLSLAFTAHRQNQISVFDPDAGENPIKVRLQVDRGTLSFAYPDPPGGDLTYVIGDGRDDKIIEFTTPQAIANKTLEWLYYTPPTYNLFQWKSENGGNNHWYEYIATSVGSWTQSRDYAVARGGYLATITSQPETDFINSIIPFAPTNAIFIGGYQDRSSANYSEPSGGWRWVTEEPWSYTNWDSTEPGNLGGNEDIVAISSSRKWHDDRDDVLRNFNMLIEYDFNPIPTFDTLTITTNDQGYFGTGGPKQDTDFVRIDLTKVTFADAPTWETRPAELDTSFDGDGRQILSVSSGLDLISHMFQLRDGKILAVGAVNNHFGVLRFNSDLTLDSSFGNGGVVESNFGDGKHAQTVEVDRDERYLVGGHDFLARYLTNGQLDASFGVNGRVSAGSTNPIYDIAIQPDGKILTTGRQTDGFWVSRFSLNGTLESTWTFHGSTNDSRAIQVDDTGDFLISGFVPFGPGFRVTRVDVNGLQEATFVYDINPTSGGETTGGSLRLPDGKMLVVGGSDWPSGKVVVTRHLATGAIDTKFGSNGSRIFSAINGQDLGSRGAIQADGKLLITGTANNGVNNDFFVARLSYDGELDTSFNSSGIRAIDLGGEELARGIISQPNGKIVIAGRSGNEIALVRLLGDSNLNKSPTDINLSTSSIDENAGANAVVGMFSTVDPNAGDTFTYSFVAGTGDTDNAAFNISGSTLRANSSFDFENKSNYTVRIRSTDQDGLFFEKAFTISVTNVNDVPTLDPISNLTINEDAGTQIVQLSGVTAGAGESQPLQLTAVSSNTALINNVQVLTTEGGFGSVQQYTAQNTTHGVTTGDFDKDGNLDIAVGNQFSDSATIVFGNGSGGFTAPISIGVGNQPYDVVAGDFNGDGFDDIVASNFENNLITIRRGAANRTFSAAQSFASGDGTAWPSWTGVWELQAADVNGDGKLDILAGNQRHDFVSVMLGNGTGGFGAPIKTQTLGAANGSGSLYGLTVADFNKDGRQDIAVTIAAEDAVKVLLGNNNGTFTLSGTYAVGDNPFEITAGDFDADGSVDLAAVMRFPSTAVYPLWNNGTGVFGVGTAITVAGNWGWSITSGDVDGDGDHDIAFGGPGDGGVIRYLESNGNRTFATAQTFTLDPAGRLSAEDLRFADFNRDGILDIVTASNKYSETGAIGVLLGTLPSYRLSFSPLPDQNGQAVITATVEDGGNDLNLATKGDNATFIRSFTVTVNAVNDAPILNTVASPTFGSVLEGASDPSGIAVADMVVDGSITDPDGPAVEAIAITGLNPSLGAWQYKLNGGSTWLTINASLINSQTNELALLLGPTAMLRLVPFGDLNGLISDGITFRAWDQTGGIEGQYQVISASGGASAFSVAADTASIAVIAVNDAPTFFGGTGIVTAGIADVSPFPFQYGYSVTVQPDGKILVGGGSVANLSGGSIAFDFGLWRYNPDGSLDPSFGIGGRVSADLSGGNNAVEEAYSVTLQPDGKILLAGITPGFVNKSGASAIAIARFNSNGTLDTSFGTEGKIVADFIEGTEIGYSIVVQPNGKIIVGGYTYNQGFTILRYNSDGSFDTGFGASGRVTTQISWNNDQCFSIAVQSDGKIVAGGYASMYEIALARYNSDGSLDASFGSGGIVLANVGESSRGFSVNVQPDGKIVLAGESQSQGKWNHALMRFNTDGSVDLGFGSNGRVTVEMPRQSVSGVIQPDGKIVFGGARGLIRLNADGSQDTSFAPAVEIGTDAFANSLYLQADGKFVVVGSNVARFAPDGSLDTSFNVSNTLGGIVSYVENASPIVLDPNVAISDAELSRLNNFATASLTLVRNGGASNQDRFSATGSLGALNQGGNLVVAGTTMGTVTANDAGTLVLTFNTNATNALINSAMRQIAYSNTSNSPPASVQINWIFNDGNSGAQGTSGAMVATGQVTVAITDVNNAPTDVTLLPNSIAENASANASVGTLSTVDPDAADIFTYTLVTGTGDTDNAAFFIDGSILHAKNSFDFETKSSYAVRVRSTDEGGLFVDKVLSINVTNINEVPTDLSLSKTSIAENAGTNATVGTLSTVDPDSGNTFTYSLVSGTGSTDNASFNISGNTLRATNSFDFETKSSYSVRIRSTDQDGLSTEKAFIITVIDMNENTELTGTTGNDSFVATYTGDGVQQAWSVTLNGTSIFSGSISAGANLSIDGLAGTDSLQIIGRSVADAFRLDGNEVRTNDAILLSSNIESRRILAGAGDDSLVVVSGIASFDGGSGIDRVEAVSGNNTWNITGSGAGNVNGAVSFSTTESVRGGSGDDQFVFGPSGRLTSLVQGGAGTDTLNLSAKTSSHSINLLTGTATSTGGISQFENFIGSAASNDTLIATNVANTWDLSSANTGTLNGTTTFSGFENLTGGTASDTFVFAASATLTGTANGGTGVDTLNLSARTVPLEFQLGTVSTVAGTIGGYSGMETMVGNGVAGSKITGANTTTAWVIQTDGAVAVGGATYQGVRTLVGGTAADTLTGPNVAGTWTLSGSNRGTIDLGAPHLFSFSGMENLTSGTANDAFVIGVDGSLTGTANGGTGVDTLNLSARTVPLEFQLGTVSTVAGTIGGYSGMETVIGNGVAGSKILGTDVATAWVINTSGQIVVSRATYSGVRAIVAGIGLDTLTGPALASASTSAWTVSGINMGALDIGVASFTFSGVENLTGGTGADAFEILPAGRIEGNMNGGTGTGLNSLSYAQWSDGVTVDLSVASAGNASAVLGIASNLQMVTGGSGDDELTGQLSRSTILIGLEGNDTLIGGSQRDLLFGGIGSDTINGGLGDDLIIGGRTSHDRDRAAMLRIYAEWTSTRTFAQRTANLWGTGTGTKSNGSTFLNNDTADAITDTVFADTDTDSLTGGLGQDWFFASASEITDLVSTGSAPDRRN